MGKNGKDHDDDHEVSDSAHLSAKVTELRIEEWKKAHSETKGKGVFGFAMPAKELLFGGNNLDMTPGKQLFGPNDLILTGNLGDARMNPASN